MIIIDWQITKESIGNNKEYFDNHPSSHKKVYVMCLICGLYRWTEYRLSHKLCRSCISKRSKND